ncbi:hypothetical protein HK102_011744 [Quaeritorhiza haematococci]|nr:hypothetical protein HK102_011744 [Quaeritorhiza haematococci]
MTRPPSTNPTDMSSKILSEALTVLRTGSKVRRHTISYHRFPLASPNNIEIALAEKAEEGGETQEENVVGGLRRSLLECTLLRKVTKELTKDVNEVWAGLGYYSRAKRLHEGAKIVVEQFGGKLPREAEELKKNVPGVGPYTAGAISSIAYNQPAPLVDGNVIRVFSRLRAYGGDPKSKEAVSYFWSLAETLLDPSRPGDFNQALMDLGATVCTPANPSCKSCPVNEYCRAYAEQKAHRIIGSEKFFGAGKKRRRGQDEVGDEDENTAAADTSEICTACDGLADIEDFNVTRFPLKVKRKQQRYEDCFVCILELREPGPVIDTESTSAESAATATPKLKTNGKRRKVDTATSEAEATSWSRFLVVQKPDSGLLANLWDFPNIIRTPPPSSASSKTSSKSSTSSKQTNRRKKKSNIDDDEYGENDKQEDEENNNENGAGGSSPVTFEERQTAMDTYIRGDLGIDWIESSKTASNGDTTKAPLKKTTPTTKAGTATTSRPGKRKTGASENSSGAQEPLQLEVLSRVDLGTCVHLFSHIRRVMHVEHVIAVVKKGNIDANGDLSGGCESAEGDVAESAKLQVATITTEKKSKSRSMNSANKKKGTGGGSRAEKEGGQNMKWLTKTEMLESTAVPATLKKAFAMLGKN